MNTPFGSLMMVLLLIQFSLPAKGQSLEQQLKLTEPQKTQALINWYFQVVRHYEPRHAKQALEKLQTLSAKRKDPAAAAAALYFRGQYLAVKMNDKAGEKLMQQGLDLAIASGNNLQSAYFRHHLGFYFFFRNTDYSRAMRLMLEAHHDFNDAGYKTIPDAEVYLNRLGFVFFHLGNYHEALDYLQLALKFPGADKGVGVTVLNSIGQCYRNLYRFHLALLYFTRAYDAAMRANNAAWIGISAGSIGHLHLQLGNYSVARPYCDLYYRYSLQAKDTACIAEALCYLSALDVATSNTGSALDKLKRSDSLLATVFRNELKTGGAISKENYLRQLFLFRTFASAYHQAGAHKDGMRYMQLTNMLRDSLEKRSLVSGSLAVKEQLALEQHRSALQLVQREKQNMELKQYAVIAFLVLVIAISLLVYNRQQLKIRQQKELEKKHEALMIAEKRRVEAELLHAERLLENYTENLRQKNELLEQVQTEIEALRTLHGDDQPPQILYLNTLANSSILTEEDWENFSHLFDKVHTGFLVKLKEKFPHLTPAEVRLLSLTRLKLSTKEMASMLGVSADTIKKTRQRLRKKIDLAEDQSLEDMVGYI